MHISPWMKISETRQRRRLYKVYFQRGLHELGFNTMDENIYPQIAQISQIISLCASASLR